MQSYWTICQVTWVGTFTVCIGDSCYLFCSSLITCHRTLNNLHLCLFVSEVVHLDNILIKKLMKHYFVKTCNCSPFFGGGGVEEVEGFWDGGEG